MRTLVLSMGLVVLLSHAYAQEDTNKWSFVVSRGGKAIGRLVVGIASAEDSWFVSAAFYEGEKAVKSVKGLHPKVRSYAELQKDMTIGKYKRWEPIGKGSRYWMLFPYEGKVRLRYEKGPGDKGRVKELGDGESVSPLDREQPQLAYLLVRSSRTGVVPCASANPAKLGTANVTKIGEEEIEIYGGSKQSLTKWTVTGSCGEFQIFVDGRNEPVVMTAGQIRYDKIP